MDMNQVTLIGRVVANPITRENCCRILLAVREGGMTERLAVTAPGALGGVLQSRVHVGSKLYVDARIRSDAQGLTLIATSAILLGDRRRPQVSLASNH